MTSTIGSFLFILGILICAGIQCAWTLLVRVFTQQHIHRHPNTRDIESGQYKQAYPYPPRVSSDLGDYADLLGLTLTVHEVVTTDGFILVLHRLSKRGAETNGKPVLLIHGLMQSSASFLTSGYKSIAYLLVSSGFDVWLGNNRCGFHPKHLTYSKHDPQMWEWDVTEMAQFDIPAMIDHMHSIRKDKSQVSLVSHSQGTTQCVYMMSNQHKSTHIHHIDKVVLLAPAVYGGPLLNSQLFIGFMRILPGPIYNAFFGRTSFMAILVHMRSLTLELPGFGTLAYTVFNYLFNWDDTLWDAQIRKHHFIFSPVYVSVKLMRWWLQGKDFSYGMPVIKDPGPWFDNEGPDLLVVVGGRDDLVDGRLFVKRLQDLESGMKGKWKSIVVPEYSHLDVLWADDVLERIGDDLIEFVS